MKDLIGLVIASLLLVALFAIGAWLVVQGHPWFALLVFLAAVSIRIKMD